MAPEPVPCASPKCRAPVIRVFVENNAGRKLRRMPLNPEPDPAGNVAVRVLETGALRGRVLGKGQEAVAPEVAYMPHFATCADPEAHRRRQRGNWTAAVNARKADQRRGRTRGHGHTTPPDILPGMTRLHPRDQEGEA